MESLRHASFSRALAGLAVLLLLGASGCGSPKFYPVRGKVRFADTFKPLMEGEVRFQPISRTDLIASGTIGRDGTFSLSTPSHGEGALEGPCRVAVVVPPRKGRPVLDERFQDFDKADLQFTVTARTENYFFIDVARPGR